MNLRSQRRIAADLLKCGKNRVWIDPEANDDVAMAITRSDIRSLIESSRISKHEKIGVSRYRAKLRHERRKRGLARGTGKRKGSKFAIVHTKTHWINTIRPIRRTLKAMREKSEISKKTYRTLYLKAKGGAFHSVAHMNRYIDENKMRN